MLGLIRKLIAIMEQTRFWETTVIEHSTLLTRLNLIPLWLWPCVHVDAAEENNVTSADAMITVID